MHHWRRLKNVCDNCNGTGKVLDSKAIGEYLSGKRKEFGNSLRAVAFRMKISAPYLSDLENGNRSWTEEKIQKFESAVIPMPKKSGRIIFIYGLFNGKICEYIGATAYPKDRKQAHRINKKHLTFMILTKCDRSVAEEVESRLIKEQKAKGFCKLNKISHKSQSSSWFY